MSTRNTIRAGRSTKQAVWLLPGILLLVVLLAMLVRSGTTRNDSPAPAVAAAVPSVVVPSAEITAVPSAVVTASAPGSTPVPVDPVRTEAEVTAIATNHLALMATAAEGSGLTPVPAKLESVAATRWSDVSAVEPSLADVPAESGDASRVIWVARGEGTFLVTRTGLSGKGPWIGETGYLLIDDETGEIVGMGTP